MSYVLQVQGTLKPTVPWLDAVNAPQQHAPFVLSGNHNGKIPANKKSGHFEQVNQGGCQGEQKLCPGWVCSSAARVWQLLRLKSQEDVQAVLPWDDGWKGFWCLLFPWKLSRFFLLSFQAYFVLTAKGPGAFISIHEEKLQGSIWGGCDGG